MKLKEQNIVDDDNIKVFHPKRPTLFQIILCHTIVTYIVPEPSNAILLILDIVLNRTSTSTYALGLSLLLLRSTKVNLFNLLITVPIAVTLKKLDILPLGDAILFTSMLCRCLQCFKYVSPFDHISTMLKWSNIIITLAIPIALQDHPWSIDGPLRHINRKAFHFILLLMFLGSSEEIEFCSFSTTMVTIFFLGLEVLKHRFAIPKIPAHFLSSSDHPGSPIILSHIFLLLGSTAPIYLSVSKDWTIGLRAIGVLDSFTCIGGLVLSGPKLPLQNRSKTLSGSVVGILSWIVFQTFSGGNFIFPFKELAMQGVLLSVWEAYSPLNDNLTLPIISSFLLLKQLN